MHSKISAHLIGHLTAEPRLFDLPRTGGVGCELRLTIARPDFDSNGCRITRNRYVKVVTYDTKLAADIHRNVTVGDFVEIMADDVRSEKPWFSPTKKAWMSGGVTFTLTKIRKATALTPEDDGAASGPDVLEGVIVGGDPQSADRNERLGEAASQQRPAGRRSRRQEPVDAGDATYPARAAEPAHAA